MTLKRVKQLLIFLLLLEAGNTGAKVRDPQYFTAITKKGDRDQIYPKLFECTTKLVKKHGKFRYAMCTPLISSITECITFQGLSVFSVFQIFRKCSKFL